MNSDISTLNKNAELLRINKQDQVDAVNALGFTHITMDTPLSEIATCIKWAGGLADLHLAAYNKVSHKTEYITKERWDGMGITERSSYVRVGVRMRAEGHAFIVAAEDAKYNNSYTMMWGGQGTDVSGITNYGENSSGLYDYSDEKAAEDCLKIIDKLKDVTYSGVTGAPACEAARDFTVAQDSTTRGWHLPSLIQLRLMMKYYTQLQQAFSDFDFSTTYSMSGYYWSCNEYSNGNAWSIYFGYGGSNSGNKNYTFRCRPVAPVVE